MSVLVVSGRAPSNVVVRQKALQPQEKQQTEQKRSFESVRPSFQPETQSTGLSRLSQLNVQPIQRNIFASMEAIASKQEQRTAAREGSGSDDEANTSHDKDMSLLNLLQLAAQIVGSKGKGSRKNSRGNQFGTGAQSSVDMSGVGKKVKAEG